MPPDEFPDCTRCSHSFEEHERPEGSHDPWPCTKCDCPGFVVSRDLQEDVKHMAILRLRQAVCELHPEHMTAREIHAEVTGAMTKGPLPY